MTALKNNHTSISHEQRKKIYAMSRQANIDNNELHEYINEWTGVHSLSSNLCSGSQANKIISSLESIINKSKMTFIPAAPVSPKATVRGGATPKQLNAIKAIQRSLQWNDARLKGFIEHTASKNDLFALSLSEASKVIIGLKKMTTS